ncbi:MAG: 2-amino-4-hydroxy-6-hydroxymethyldihydropteridine diphosphokinase [Phycisphaerales bacterium]
MDTPADETWTPCAIALGSNLGDRATHLHGAIRSLASTPGVRALRVSTFHETEPVGPVEQGRFLNAAAIFETTLTPQAILTRLHEIEREHGRERHGQPRWGPRTLDLDLLLYADAIIEEPGLSVPHPRMSARQFVLAPLAELASDWVVPGTHRTVGELLAAITV